MRDEMKKCKVGDLIYTESRFRGFAVKQIKRETANYFIIEGTHGTGVKYEIKIRKNDGYQVGSGGNDRASMFDHCYWYPMNEEKEIEFDTAIIIKQFKDFSMQIFQNKIKTRLDLDNLAETLQRLKSLRQKLEQS